MCERSCGRIDAGLPVLLVFGERSRLVLLVFGSRELVEKLCFWPKREIMFCRWRGSQHGGKYPCKRRTKVSLERIESVLPQGQPRHLAKMFTMRILNGKYFTKTLATRILGAKYQYHNLCNSSFGRQIFYLNNLNYSCEIFSISFWVSCHNILGVKEFTTKFVF